MSSDQAPNSADSGRFVVPRESLISRYELIGRLGSGGMAEVFLARALGIADFEKIVVLKRILPDKRDDPRFVGMLRDEARVAAVLDHPNIVHTYDVGVDDGGVFIAMEYIDGEDVRTLLDRVRKANETIPLPLALQIATGAAAGLHHAHEQTDTHGTPLSIVHRDVSPANIIVTRHSTVKLIDFGIAKAGTTREQTAVGTLKGKVAYMSPEQVRGLKLDRRSDVFALGIVIYELVTMVRPFEADNQIAVMHRVCQEPHVPADERRPTLPASLGRVIDRALAKDPEERYPSAFQLLEDLERVTRDENLHALPGALGRYLEHVFGPRVPPWLDATEARAHKSRAAATQTGRRAWDLEKAPARPRREPTMLGGVALGFTAAMSVFGIGWWAWGGPKPSGEPAAAIAASSLPTAAPKDAAKAEEMLEEAGRVALAGRDKEALELVERSLRLRKSAAGYAKLAMIACRLGDAKRARSAHAKLSGRARTDVERVCASRGVEL